MSLLLALVMVMSFAFTACTNSGDSSEKESKVESVSESVSESESESESEEESVYLGNDEQVDFNFSVPADENITYPTDPTVMPGMNAVKQGHTYTYRTATNSLPTSWNIHTYQANAATLVLDYTTDALYTFDYNLTLDGYRIVPSMATDYPVDVTSEFIGEYGIDEDAVNRVYKISLRDDLKFDNGDAITADTFVESMKLLLNPEAANYRADSYFKGNLTIHGAKDYALQGSLIQTSAREKYDVWEDAKTDSTVYFDLMSDGSNFAQVVLGMGYGSYKDADHGWAGILYKGYGAIPSLDYLDGLQGKTWAEIEADADLLERWTTVISWWQSEPNEELDFFVFDEEMPAYAWEDVGFFAKDGDLYVVNDNELSGFYLLYSLSTDFFLVHPATYRACMSEVEGVYTNSYGTSVDTYVGFGPYKLTQYVADNSIAFAKNANWHGYSNPANANYYQTTNISILQVADEQTRLNMFLAGDLDAYGLAAADMEEYQSSPYTYYQDGDSTWFVALNPDMEGLRDAQAVAEPLLGDEFEVNKTIITIKEFRQALSFSIDRAAYALALDPLGGTAKALYGNMIISDPNTGTAYRTTEEAKDAILEFWGLADLVGVVYETKDEAIDSITGYDLAGAKRLFDVAYQKAVEQGLITSENFEIQIMIGQPGSGQSAYYNNGYELLKQVWTDAVSGTALEGHISFRQSQPLGSSSFSDFLKDNSVDVLFGVGWTGSALDPYGLMEAYVAPDYQYDPGWNTSLEMLQVTLTDNDGKELTLQASVFAWGAEALAGKEIKANVVINGVVTTDYVMISAGTTCNPDIRLTILAAVEGAVLNQYDMIPINLDASASMKGMKIKYGTEEYVFGVGRGGIKYMSYYYSDSEWAAFVAANAVDGKLNYKG